MRVLFRTKSRASISMGLPRRTAAVRRRDPRALARDCAGSQLAAPATLIGRDTSPGINSTLSWPEPARFVELRKRPAQQLVVIGGGVSGGAGHELAYALRAQPAAADPARVTLLQGAARLLPQLERQVRAMRQR